MCKSARTQMPQRQDKDSPRGEVPDKKWWHWWQDKGVRQEMKETKTQKKKTTSKTESRQSESGN